MDEEFDESMIDTPESASIDDAPEDDYTDPKAGHIANFVSERYNSAKTARYTDEVRWLQAYRNYRGIYGPNVQFTEHEKSRVFIKVTKTKVLAAYGQIVEVLFGNNKFPISIDPTTLPEGISDSVHFKPKPPAPPPMPGMPPQAGPVGATQTPQDSQPKLQPGETLPDFKRRVGPLHDRLKPIEDKVKDGPGYEPGTVTFHPAMVAAKQMEKKIHDQLEESNANKQLRLAAFECALFGTGIMKGPFAVDKEYPNWSEDGEYTPTIKTVPMTSHVSIWNLFPDPDANTVEECEYVVERHKMTRSQIRALKRRPHFRANAINKAIDYGENYVKEWWEQAMEDGEQGGGSAERFEVIEFWGYVDTDKIKEQGIVIPKELKSLEQLNVNVWVCNGQVLRLVMNPFKPTYLPYYAVPYEVNPYSFFGVGVAENMDDTQTIMNGFMRMSIDNAALSGNLLIEIDESNLVPGQDLSIYPGKVFRREGGAPGQAIFGTKFPNVSNENMQIFDKARQLADESTGFPSFAHGQTGVSGVGRTASGISMLMSAANGSIRNVVKNVDDYLLSPLGKSFFHFNMQFDFDPKIRGDFEVKAQGTESLMANEVRSQRLMQFLSVVQNPILAPFAKMDYLIREIAKSMDLDPDKVTNSIGDAAIQAEIMGQMATAQAPQGPAGGPPMGPGGANPAVPAPSDTQGSGGGNMGIGSAPTPGEQGFSAAGGGE